MILQITGVFVIGLCAFMMRYLVLAMYIAVEDRDWMHFGLFFFVSGLIISLGLCGLVMVLGLIH